MLPRNCPPIIKELLAKIARLKEILADERFNLYFSVSCTTRLPRVGEEDGKEEEKKGGKRRKKAHGKAHGKGHGKGKGHH